MGKAGILYALRCLAVCPNQKMCADRMEQVEVLDVLSVGVALGDAGMLYDSSFRCFYQKENTLVLQRERERKIQGAENWQVCVCLCVCVM